MAQTQDMEPSDYLTVSEAAGVKRVSREAVRLAIERGDLPASRVGGRWLIRRADLDCYRPDHVKVLAGRALSSRRQPPEQQARKKK
jgi:excisionase family DNA binding protein